MTLRAFIGDHELDLPPDFTFPIERYSPWYDDSLRLGDLSMGIEFPATAQNRIALGFADELHQAGKVISYPDFRVVAADQIYTGTLQLQNSEQNRTGGKFTANFITNRIPQITTPLPDLLTKTINLGSTTAAIIAAAKAQNAAAMSSDGTTGAVMKFVPHQNTDLYDPDINPDWYPDADAYDPAKAYDAGAIVTFQTQKTLFDPTRYITRIGVPVAWPPNIYPDDWKPWRNAIVNAWDAENATFFQNAIWVHGERYSVNIHAMVPWLQLHAVIRHLAEVLGYTAQGTFLADTAQQRELLFSNHFLARFEAYFLLLALDDGAGNNTVDLPAATPSPPALPIVLADADPDNDAYSLLDTGTGKIGLKRKGQYIYKVRGYAHIDDADPGQKSFRMSILDDSNTVLDYVIVAFPDGSFPTSGDRVFFETELKYYYTYAAADDSETFNTRIFAGITYSATASGTLTDVEINVINDSFQRIDQYGGEVRYANHVPNVPANEFLLTLAELRGLSISFHTDTRIMQLDYIADQIVRTSEPTALPQQVETTTRLQNLPARRWEMEYGNPPRLFDADEGHHPDAYIRVDTPDQIIDTIYSTSFNKNQARAIYVRTLNAWFTIDTKSNNWKLDGHHYPTLRIQEEGDLTTISPKIGPVPMGFFRNSRNQRITNPVIAIRGRGDTLQTSEEHAELMTCYWLGLDTSVIPEGYPLATTTRYNAAGITILDRDMSLTTLYTLHWKRIMQLMVLEERITALFHFPPDVRRRISFDRAMLLGHVPVIPIRTAETISATTGTLEIEARKVKMVEVEIVSDQKEAEPEVDNKWTPAGTTTSLWIDAADINTLILTDTDTIASILDKSGQLNHALQINPSLRPIYLIGHQNGLNVMRFNGTQYLSTGLDSDQPLITFSIGRFDSGSTNTTTMHSGSPGPGDRAGQVFFNPSLGGSFGIFNGAVLYEGGSYRDTPIMFTGVHSGCSSSLSIDGDLKITGNAGSQNLNNFMIGAQQNGGYQMRGEIYEIVVITEIPTLEIIQKIEGYMAWKWGINDLLPVDHPYRLAPPII